MATSYASSEQLAQDFDRVATRYNLLNTLNPGYRKHLRWSAERLGVGPRARILDLCCGTGLSTEALRRAYPGAELTALDASRGMIECAQRNSKLAGVRFLVGDAVDPKAAGAEGPYDGILMAYGIRNVMDRDLCLRNLRALLADGGRIAFHEYSVAGNPLGSAVWNVVASTVIIPMGGLLTSAPELFRYLRQSVNGFDSVPAFVARLQQAGFSEVQVQPMDGWQRGIAHTFLARK